MALANANDPLRAAFERFKNEREKLKFLLKETEKQFKEIEGYCKEMPSANELEKLLLHNSEKMTVESVFQDPCIIVVGQTKSGKSSLVNELLGKTIVKAEQRPCTARLVELLYGNVKKPIVTVRATDGRILDQVVCQKDMIPARMVNLSTEDRENEALVEATVTIQINNDFLRSGVKLVDSPGRNENKVLDKLIIEHLKTILPFIVYVIDGKNLLTIQDVKDINGIMKNMPGGNILYIVSKIDPTKEEAFSSEEDSDEEDERSDEEIEKSVKRKVFDKLVSHGFIARNVEMEKCNQFHALSAWKIKTYRRKLQGGEVPPPENKRYVDDLEHFKRCLLDFAKHQLIECVERAAESLRGAHTRCLEFFIGSNNRLFEERRRIESEIALINEVEAVLSCTITEIVKSNMPQLKQCLSRILQKENTNRIIQDMDNLQYQTEHFTIPPDGFIKDGDDIEMCRKQIKEFIIVKLNEEIHNVIVQEFEKQDGVIELLAKQVRTLEEGAGRESGGTAAQSLMKILVKCYRFDFRSMDIKLSLWSRIKSAVQAFFRKLRLPRYYSHGKLNVRSKEWKEQTAAGVLEGLDAGQMSNEIRKGLDGHLLKGHEDFQREINKLKELYLCSWLLGEELREKIRQVSPTLARLELSCSDLIDQHRYGNFELKEELGRGAQGVVYASTCLGPNKEQCAVKVVKFDTTAFATADDALNDLALEIHYCRQFNHPRLMEVFGTIMTEETEGVYKVQIIYEKMASDLMHALPKIQGIREKVKIAMEIAEALQYLQRNQMIHRDIKCSNILVGKNGHIKLTDFGFCKPEGMTTGSLVGTPIHIAPEIVARKSYNKSVDIYSFGIVFWYICEGKGNHPLYVQNAPCAGLLLMWAEEKRPEWKDWFNDDCWNLMNQCWDGKPEDRPSADKILETLKEILTTL